eukprot:m.658217 g.658217  ORF g.658217 m.658217 type:complete len:95 (-) comp22716_c0_seq53:2943-3227(-)
MSSGCGRQIVFDYNMYSSGGPVQGTCFAIPRCATTSSNDDAVGSKILHGHHNESVFTQDRGRCATINSIVVGGGELPLFYIQKARQPASGSFFQ